MSTAEYATAGETAEKNAISTFLKVLIGFVWIALFVMHAVKALGYYSMIAPDEYYYIADIRHRSYSDAILGNYLFSAIYSLTGLFGSSFLEAGRVLNALLFMMSAPFLYGVARQVCDRTVSLFVTFMILASPFSTYTMYFMPESIYFCGFWAFFWLLTVKAATMPLVRMAMFAGAGMGVLSLLKYHGILLMPGLLIFLFLIAPRNNLKEYSRSVCMAGIAAVIAFLFVKLSVGFLFAGTEGLVLTSRLYGDSVEKNRLSFPSFSLLFNYMLFSLRGQLTGLLALFAPVLAMGIDYFVGKARSEGNDPLRRIILLAFCFLAPLMFVTASYTTTLTVWYPEADPLDITRIPWRYYNFLFPAFPIVTAGLAATLGRDGRSALSRLIVYGALAAGVVLVFVVGFTGYFIEGAPDCPELDGMAKSPLFFSAILTLLLCTLLVGIVRPRSAARGYLYIVLPVLLLGSSCLVQFDIANRYYQNATAYDVGGIMTKESLDDKCSELTVVDRVPYKMTKALIHIDNPETDYVYNNGLELDMSTIKPGKKWLLVFNNVVVPAQHIKSIFKHDIRVEIPELHALGEQSDVTFVNRILLIELAR